MFKRLGNLFRGKNTSNNLETVDNVLKGRYKIMEALSAGGMGETYLAIDLDIPVTPKPKCVIKKLRPHSKNNPTIVRLFEEEAKVLYELGKEHEQIPELYAYFVEDDDFYLVQGFINGHDLSTEIDNVEYKPPQNNQSGSAPTILVRKQWEETAVIALLKEVLTLLVYIHEQGVIHRDIKPANLMRCNTTGKLNLIDFGSVKAVSNQVMNEQGQTQLTVAIGTPGYIPSEQWAGRPNFSSDLYALGITAIQALTGFYPDSLPTEEHEIQWRKLAKVSDELATFLDKMIHFDCYQRYQSASEALEVLETIPIPESELVTIQHKGASEELDILETISIRKPKLLSFELNGKYGFISQGKVIIPFQFYNAYHFQEGLAAVQKNGKWGYINTQGELVIPFQFYSASSFREGLAVVEKERIWYNKYGYINAQGELVIPFQFYSASSFREGLATVKKHDIFGNSRYGSINAQGELVIPCQFKSAYWFREGLARVEEYDIFGNSKYGYINTKGSLIIPFQFDNARGFNQELARVRKDGKWGYINSQGELVISFQFDDSGDFKEELAEVRKDGKYGYINTQGELVIPYQFDYADDLKEGLARVKKDGQYGYINNQEKLVIPCQFDSAYSFKEGLGAVKKDVKWGYINAQGELVIPYQFDSAYSFKEGLGAVKKDGKYGYINNQGEVVIPFQFDRAYGFEEGLAKVQINETEYLINRQGEIVYPKIGYNE